RSVEARDKAEFERISAGDKNDGNTRCRSFGREYCRWSEGAYYGHMALDEIGRHPRQRIIAVRYPAIFDRDVLTLDVAHFGKATAECSIELNGNVLCQAAQVTDHRHCCRLRPCRDGPRRRRAAE